MILTTFVFLLTTLMGGWCFIWLGKKVASVNLGVILSFGGAFIIGMCFLHLVPESFETTNFRDCLSLPDFYCRTARVSKQGIEHGHFHGQSWRALQ